MAEIDEERYFREKYEKKKKEREAKEKKKPQKPFDPKQPLEHTKGVPLTPGLFKELPFFKMEPYLIMIICVISGVSLALEALGLLIGIAIPISFMLIVFILVLFLTKWFAFMPSGRRLFVEKNLEGGAVQVLVMKPPKDNKIHFARDDLDIPPTTVDRYNKHYEFYTGRPWVKAAQNHSPSYSVYELFEGKRDPVAKENEAVLQQTYDAGLLDGMAIALKMKDALKQPMTWVAIITLGAIVVLIALGFLQLDTLSQIADEVIPN